MGDGLTAGGSVGGGPEGGGPRGRSVGLACALGIGLGAPG